MVLTCFEICLENYFQIKDWMLELILEELTVSKLDALR